MALYYYYCDTCDYGIALGFSHYVGINREGYGGTVQFVCKNCFTTHAREIGPGKERFIYQSKRLKRDDSSTPDEQEEYTVSLDEQFCCPVCQKTEMITDKDIQEDGETEFICPDCHESLKFLGKRGV